MAGLPGLGRPYLKQLETALDNQGVPILGGIHVLLALLRSEIRQELIERLGCIPIRAYAAHVHEDKPLALGRLLLFRQMLPPNARRNQIREDKCEPDENRDNNCAHGRHKQKLAHA